MLKWVFFLVTVFLAFFVIPHFLSWRIWRKALVFEAPGRYCAITFDDGPSPLYTAKILDILRAHSVRCTFFLVGKKCLKYPHLVKKIIREGHELGIHGWDHCHPWLQNPLSLGGKIERTRKTLEALLNEVNSNERVELREKVFFFRPPWGFWTLWNRHLTRKYPPILWTVPGKDWARGATPQSVASNVLSHMKGSEIILIHDGGRYSQVTVEALPAILDGLAKKGYVPLTCSDFLMKAKLDKLRKARQKPLGKDVLDSGRPRPAH